MSDNEIVPGLAKEETAEIADSTAAVSEHTSSDPVLQRVLSLCREIDAEYFAGHHVSLAADSPSCALSVLNDLRRRLHHLDGLARQLDGRNRAEPQPLATTIDHLSAHLNVAHRRADQLAVVDQRCHALAQRAQQLQRQLVRSTDRLRALEVHIAERERQLTTVRVALRAGGLPEPQADVESAPLVAPPVAMPLADTQARPGTRRARA